MCEWSIDHEAISQLLLGKRTIAQSMSPQTQRRSLCFRGPRQCESNSVGLPRKSCNPWQSKRARTCRKCVNKTKQKEDEDEEGAPSNCERRVSWDEEIATRDILGLESAVYSQISCRGTQNRAFCRCGNYVGGRRMIGNEHIVFS